MTKSAKIRRLVTKGKSPSEIAKALKVNPNYVHTIMWLDRKKKKKPSKIVKAVKEMKQVLGVIEKKPEVHKSLDGKVAWVKIPDAVNNPPHYTDGGVDTLTYIEAKDLNYRLGNVVKYVSRCGKKLGADPLQDLMKARFYLQREIDVRREA